MKISLLRIQNLFSYKDEIVDFEDYNVILGLNASGKTNLIRLLKFLSFNSEAKIRLKHESKYFLDNLSLGDDIRLNDSDSSVTIGVSLSGQEQQLFFWLFCQRDDVKVGVNHDSNFYLTIYWKKTSISKNNPSMIFLIFPNGLGIWYHESEYRVCFTNWDYKQLIKENYAEHLQKIKNLIDIKPVKRLNTASQNSHGFPRWLQQH